MKQRAAVQGGPAPSRRTPRAPPVCPPLPARACGATHAAFMSRVPPLSRQGPGLALRGWHRAAVARPEIQICPISEHGAVTSSRTARHHGDAERGAARARRPLLVAVVERKPRVRIPAPADPGFSLPFYLPNSNLSGNRVE